jgi:hypothetical protein
LVIAVSDFCDRRLYAGVLISTLQTWKIMTPTKPQSPSEQPEIRLTRTDAYRDSYANSVQVKMSVWDFQLIFGTMQQDAPDHVNLVNFQGVYLSPQQAKALFNVLGHNLAQYEQTFGKLALEPHVQNPGGPVN